MTAAALVPLSLWFVCRVLACSAPTRRRWRPGSASRSTRPCCWRWCSLTFHHAQLGLQVVYEDYIDGAALRTASILATKAAALLLALMAALAVIKLFLAAH